jgi:cell division cycle protein 37
MQSNYRTTKILNASKIKSKYSPNVDKKSMIRWKQAQVHKERREREDKRDLLRKEYETNEKYLVYLPEKLEKLDSLDGKDVVTYLESLSKEVDFTFTDPMRQDSLSRIQKWPGNWDAPNWGEVLKSHVPWHEEINRICKESFEQVLQDQSKDVKTLISNGFAASVARLRERQILISNEIESIEVEMNKRLTMDHLVTGFDKTFVSTENQEQLSSQSVAPAADKSPSSSRKTVEETIHVPKSQNSFFEKHVQEEILAEMEATDDEMFQKHPKLLEYSKTSDYRNLARLLSKHKDLPTEKNEECLLLRALCLEIIGFTKEAENAVKNSLIMKYSRNLGPNGVDLFFQK